MELLPRIELEPVAYETTVQPLNYSSMEADASSNSASVGYKATVLPLKLIGHATLHGRVTM